jgi:hypothetical protein
MFESFEKPISRRNVVLGAGLFALGAMVTKFGNFASVAEASGNKKWPWPYEKLDPQKTAAIAYDEWYRIFCGAAVIGSIFGQLAEKIGEPYKSFPVDSFVVLEGGMAGWGTICGSLAGANIVANVIIGPRIAGPECENGHVIGSNMMAWYSKQKLPIFVPSNPKANKESIVHTMSNSPLCHISVGKWMDASGFAISSPERKDRCARVAASIAYKLVEDLNAWKDGKYKEEVIWSPVSKVGITAQQNCGECHGSTIPEAPKVKKT